jgi:hypothetical protein
MKTYVVEYDNCCILFGDRRFKVEVEAENERDAIGKVILMKSEYAIANCVATEKN